MCALLPEPRFATRVHVALVLHADEVKKPTNTGRLAVECLANARVIVHDASTIAEAFPPRALAPDTALLFPSDDAVPLDAIDALSLRTLVVADGTWRQARKIARDLDHLPRVVLTGAPPTEYRLRAERRPGGLSTLEAIAAALDVLERAHGPPGDPARGGVAQGLRAAQRVFVERTLWQRGALRAHDVTGGIPAGAEVARGAHVRVARSS
jgi:DTW domain-containing protein YfiP